MAENISWDADLVHAELDELENSIDQYNGIAKVSYELTEGMEVMESFKSFQETLQKLMTMYFQVLENDINQISGILTDVYAMDSGIANDIVTGTQPV